MPKPLLNQSQLQGFSTDLLSVNNEPQQKKKQSLKIDQMRLDRLLRQKRSKKYIEAIHSLDAGGHVHNQEKVNEIIDAIREEFPEVEMTGVILGIVSTCHLGWPYEVHILDLAGLIVDHYKAGELMPGRMEKARSLAIRGGYDFIEVYENCLRCISSNGAVSVVNG